MSKIFTVLECLTLQTPPTDNIKVQGWVKTRRDSKAGFSFIQLNDGSSQTSLQLVLSNTLNNYETEVLHLTSGCSIQATGKLIPSQGKGQSFEMQVENIAAIGMVDYRGDG